MTMRRISSSRLARLAKEIPKEGRGSDGIRTIVGIDPGVNTGFAVTDNGSFTDICTLTFTEAQAWCLNCIKCYREQGRTDTLELVIEDPRRQFVPYAQREPQRIKGVGSVERDCKLWIEFCEFYEIPYRLVKPGKYRKVDAKTFNMWTGWKDRTSEHARAAAMMIFEGKRVELIRANEPNKFERA